MDSGEADGLLYCVMPLVTGETLRTRLERERQLPIADAVPCDRTRSAAARRANGNAVWTRGRGRMGTLVRREETKEMDHADDVRLQQQIVAQRRAKRPDDSAQHIGAAPEHARLAGRAKS